MNSRIFVPALEVPGINLKGCYEAVKVSQMSGDTEVTLGATDSLRYGVRRMPPLMLRQTVNKVTIINYIPYMAYT